MISMPGCAQFVTYPRKEYFCWIYIIDVVFLFVVAKENIIRLIFCFFVMS